jgi:hypothetical protein
MVDKTTSRVMSQMGRKGGKKGGKKGGTNRMAQLTPEERKELAQKAAEARWGKKTKKKPKNALRVRAGEQTG